MMTKKKTLLWDLDGVFANLSDFMQKEFGKDIWSRSRNEVEDALCKMTDKQGFIHLPLMPKALEIQAFCEAYSTRFDMKILTSHGSFYFNSNIVCNQKQLWLKKNLPFMAELEFIDTPDGKSKAFYANPNSILVDDTLENIQAFRLANGTAFHYNIDSHDEILKELEKLAWVETH